MNPSAYQYRAICKGVYEVIITVDCGIANVAEVKQARELGMDVIVVDHIEQASPN